MGFGVWGFGFGGLVLGVWGRGFGVGGLGFGVWGFGDWGLEVGIGDWGLESNVMVKSSQSLIFNPQFLIEA